MPLSPLGQTERGRTVQKEIIIEHDLINQNRVFFVLSSLIHHISDSCHRTDLAMNQM